MTLVPILIEIITKLNSEYSNFKKKGRLDLYRIKIMRKLLKVPLIIIQQGHAKMTDYKSNDQELFMKAVN